MRSLALALAILAACASPPVDPEGTLDRVTGGTIRVGITSEDPWTSFENGRPSGVEVEIVERFADELDADIEWVHGSEESLFAALKYSQVDLVVGGLGAKNPFSSEAAFTHPYLTTQVVVAVPAAEETFEDIAGVEVVVEAGTEEAGVLSKTDAHVILVEDVTQSSGARAIDDWLLDDFDLVDTGITLTETDHVMAVRLGENGWLVRLEKFLLDNPEEIRGILDAQDAP